MNKEFDLLNETRHNYANVILPLMARTLNNVVSRDGLLKSYLDNGYGGADKPLPTYFRNYALNEHGLNIDHFLWVR